MNKYFLLLMCAILASCQSKNFTINKDSSNANVYVDSNADELIKWAANDIAEDLGKIIGREIPVNYVDKILPENKGIYIGQFNNELVQSLEDNFDTDLNNAWEKFIIKKDQDNLFIVGSDIRVQYMVCLM